MDASNNADVHTEDPVVYPVTDNVGESGLQNVILRTLILLLDDFFKTHERVVLVGGDQFFYYKKGDRRSCVAPDVYVIDDEPTPQSEVLSWKVWERGGKVPTLALEVVSSDYRKDYRPEIVDRYQQLGVRELIRYDPEPEPDIRHLFSHYLRDPSGRLVRYPSLPDRVRSASYDFWLVRQPDKTLLLTTGPDGSLPWKTTLQREKEAADAARQAAEAKVQQLLAELARLRGES